VILEGLLSVDNALVLALMVSALPQNQQKKALRYGIWGAFIFRICAVFAALYLIKFWWLKIAGGAYLFYVAYSGLRSHGGNNSSEALSGFWLTVAKVELMDMAFSIDSILAAVAMTDKEWLIITGGILGIIAMRFAAGTFVRLLKCYPTLKITAYVLVFVIGAKLIVSVWWHPPHWLFFSLLFLILGRALVIGYFKRR